MKHRAFSYYLWAGAAVAIVSLASQMVSAEPLPLQVQETPTKTDQAPPEISAAAVRLQSGDLAGAMQELEEAVKKHPELAPAQILMAEMLMQSEPAVARQFAEQAALSSPDVPEAYAILGDLARRERHWVDASLLYEQSLKAAEAFKGNEKRKAAAEARANNGVAISAELHKDWAGMQKHAEASLKVNPKDPVALQLLGQALFEQDKPEAALEKFREAAKLDPRIHTPESILAQLYEKRGDRQKAAQWMITALKANERDLRTRLDATQWAIDTGQFDQAEAQARSALVIDPNSLQAKVFRGLIALLQKDYPVAEEWFEKAHLQDPSNGTITNNLALSLIEQNDDSKKALALKYAQMNTQLNPQDPEALSTFGWIAYKLGRLNEAESALARASRLPGVGPDSLYYRARIAVDRKNTAAAKQLLESALKIKGAFAKRQDAERLLKELNP